MSARLARAALVVLVLLSLAVAACKRTPVPVDAAEEADDPEALFREGMDVSRAERRSTTSVP